MPPKNMPPKKKKSAVSSRLIEGIVTKPLKIIPDDRGYLMECLRRDDPFFERFGQVYISAVYENMVKGWHSHREQSDFIVCVHGHIKLAAYDAREGSPTQGLVNVFHLGDFNRMLVKIPNGLLHGWMGIAPGLSLVMNCPDRPYAYPHPDEFRVDPHDNDIPYVWDRLDG